MTEKARSVRRSVCRTEVREHGGREFLVQLADADLNSPGFKNADWVVLEKSFPAFGRQTDGPGEAASAIRIKARVHRVTDDDGNNPVAEGTVRMDQTLRVALGAMTRQECGELEQDGLSAEDAEFMNHVVVTPFDGRRSLKDRFLNLLHRVVGAQPLIMRVRYSLYSDMEIPVCRIPPVLFTVLGIAEGDFVEISSIGKHENSERRTSVRVLELESSHIERRQKEVDQKGDFYPDVSGILGLNRLHREDSDLPWIFLDYERRNALNVWPGDVVRVNRSGRHLLWKRAIILAVPAIVGVVSWVLDADSVDFKWRALAMGITLAAVPLIVVYQIRKEIM